MIKEKLFIELIQVALGHRKMLSQTTSDEEWRSVFILAKQQAVAGVLLGILDKLSNNGQKLPTDILFEWIGLTERIKAANRIINQHCVELTNKFQVIGWRSCILKGQGNAMRYPEPWFRTTGDIDIWVDADRDRIKKMVRDEYPDAKECDWHIDYPVFGDTPVEIHYIPSYSRHPKYNRRLQEYFKNHANEQFCNKVKLPGAAGFVCVPTFEFNVIQQLSHIMRHFFIEGVGMRQILDFYYLLQSVESRLAVNYGVLLKYLGMYRFAQAMMWILVHVCGLDAKRTIVPYDEKRGRLLLKEILEGGNWGRYDKRVFGRGRNHYCIISYLAHSLRLAWLFPEEVVITPIVRRLYS